MVIRSALVRGIADKALAERILSPYRTGCNVQVQGSRSCGQALAADVRRDGFERLRARCVDNGIALHVCGCKNPDLISSRCHLVRPTPPGMTEASSTSLF